MTDHLASNTSGDAVPLCVDLDGTLIKSDLLLESVLVLLKSNLLYAFLLPLWLIRGKAHLKHKIASLVDLEVEFLPYNEAFLNYLKEQKAQGRSLVLATSSNRKFAEEIAQHLGLFNRVIASDSNTNLRGSRKREMLVDAFGRQGFDYAGNEAIDLKVWSHARMAVLVETVPGIRKKVEKLVSIDQDFAKKQPGLGVFLRAIRLHQWVKNFIIFIPLIMAHQLDDPKLLFNAFLAFLAFGLCASSAYLLNDLLDLSADRNHPGKKNRPLAAGELEIKFGVILIPFLLSLALLPAWFLPTPFIGLLAAYYLLTTAYSLRLKQLLIIDVLTLAGLYTMRLLAGGAAVAVPLSFWLLAFAVFLFLSLALVKRYSELLALHPEKNQPVRGRSYQLVDLEALSQFGSASGYLAVLVMALYINSETVSILYTHPKLIWMLCPLLLYWISRVWMLARRGEMHQDPVVFAIEDRTSRWVAVIALLILWVAN
jgi:4-hydroxybenzoate polyprenyltransferase